MAGIPIAVTWWGYLEVVYGWTLLKGWNIRWRDLANPLHPYQWPVPPAQPPFVPKGSVMPTAAPASTPGKPPEKKPVPV